MTFDTHSDHTDNIAKKSPWEQKPAQPNIEDFLNMIQDRFKKFRWRNGWLILAVIVIIWALSGIFVVDPQEQAAVKTFGKLTRIVGPGPNYHLPFPIESMIKERVTEVKRVEIGFRTVSTTPPIQYRAVKAESLMLTGDESIVDLEVIVQYRIIDLADYLFNIEDVPTTFRTAAEAAMREIIGKKDIDEALTTGKGQIEIETRELLDGILTSYGAGVSVLNVKLQDVQPPPQVAEAFKAVASAREEKERLINESEGYRNDLLPRANGEAEQIINQAKAYYAERINIAEGDSDRFLSVLAEYRKAKQVTRDRIRIETMESVLPRVKKIIVDESVGENIYPIISLPNTGRLLPEAQQ